MFSEWALPGLDHTKNIPAYLNLNYGLFEHSDWLEKFEQPIRALETRVA